MHRRIAFAIVLVTGTALVTFLFGRLSAQSDDGGKVDGLETIRVTGKPYVERVELRGATVHGFETTDLMARVSGYVESIPEVNGAAVDIGTVVKKDDLLAVISVPELGDEINEKNAQVRQATAAVKQAAAAVREAEADVSTRKAEVQKAQAMGQKMLAMRNYRKQQFDRINRLFEQGAVGEENKIEAEFALRAAEAEFVKGEDGREIYPGIPIAIAHRIAADARLEKAKADEELAAEDVNVAKAALKRLVTMKSFARITAPYDGIVTRRMVDRGAFVPPPGNSGAKPLFTVTRVDRVRIVVSVPTNRATRIRRGQIAIFEKIGGLKGISVSGKVTRTAEVLSKGTRMMRLEIDLKNPGVDIATKEEFALRPGLYGTVTVTVANHEFLPIVPTSAVASDRGDRDFVLVVRNGKPVKQPVRIAFNDAINVGVSSGLKSGDVVVRDLSKVKDAASY